MSALHAVQVRYPRPNRYVSATSVDHALDLMAANPGARIVAGGTDLLLEIDRGARRGVELLIDISRIAAAKEIRIDEDAAALGPMVTHNDVVRHALLVQRALPLAQACWEVGSPQLRNRATIVGNLITASPANDTISALLAMGAKVELSSLGGVRVLPVEALITGFRTTCLQSDEMITRVLVPLLQPNQRGIYVKLGNRCAQAISVVHLAIVVSFDESENVISARIALGSVAPTVVLAPLASSALVGQPLHPERIAAAAQLASESVTPIGDVRATANYRQDTIVVMVRRALEALMADRQASQWAADAPTLSRCRSSASPVVTVHPVGPADSITATVNGTSRTASGAVGATLLEWLRDGLGANGTKEGCAEGECGACTVRLDGDAVMSCLVPAGRADGAEVVTVEGLSDAGLHPVQRAFVAAGAVQCGFCTPGFLVAAESLITECPLPTAEQIRHGLAGNLCRCTGYASIVDAVQRAAEMPR